MRLRGRWGCRYHRGIRAVQMRWMLGNRDKLDPRLDHRPGKMVMGRSSGSDHEEMRGGGRDGDIGVEAGTGMTIGMTRGAGEGVVEIGSRDDIEAVTDVGTIGMRGRPGQSGIEAEAERGAIAGRIEIIIAGTEGDTRVGAEIITGSAAKAHGQCDRMTRSS